MSPSRHFPGFLMPQCEFFTVVNLNFLSASSAPRERRLAGFVFSPCRCFCSPLFHDIVGFQRHWRAVRAYATTLFAGFPRDPPQLFLTLIGAPTRLGCMWAYGSGSPHRTHRDRQQDLHPTHSSCYQRYGAARTRLRDTECSAMASPIPLRLKCAFFATC